MLALHQRSSNDRSSRLRFSNELLLHLEWVTLLNIRNTRKGNRCKRGETLNTWIEGGGGWKCSSKLLRLSREIIFIYTFSEIQLFRLPSFSSSVLLLLRRRINDASFKKRHQRQRSSPDRGRAIKSRFSPKTFRYLEHQVRSDDTPGEL